MFHCKYSKASLCYIWIFHKCKVSGFKWHVCEHLDSCCIAVLLRKKENIVLVWWNENIVFILEIMKLWVKHFLGYIESIILQNSGRYPYQAGIRYLWDLGLNSRDDSVEILISFCYFLGCEIFIYCIWGWSYNHNWLEKSHQKTNKWSHFAGMVYTMMFIYPQGETTHI